MPPPDSNNKPASVEATRTTETTPTRRYVNVNDMAQAAADKKAKALLSVGSKPGDKGYVNVEQAGDNRKEEEVIHDYELASSNAVDADYATLDDQHAVYKAVVRMDDGVYDNL
eukprot:m.60107 g.60107  ORF g.60107 m.60107 type:complete len:113 (-) comp22802_c0_seq1:42-380(-)